MQAHFLGRWKRVTWCGMLLACCLLPLTSMAEEEETPPSLTPEQVGQMLRAGVGDVDLIVLADSRGLNFVVSEEVAEAMRELSASQRLICILSLCSNQTLKVESQADDAIEAGNYNKALALTQEIVKYSPYHIRAYQNLAKYYNNLGEFDQAVSTWTKLISIFPFKEWDYLIERGIVHSRMGNYSKAIEDFSNVTDSMPARMTPPFSLFIQRGNAYQQQGEFGRAFQDFYNAVKLYPREPNGYANSAFLLGSCPARNYRNGPRAVNMAETAIDLLPDDPQFAGIRANVLDALGVAKAETGDFSGAIDAAEEASDLRGAGSNQEILERIALYKDQKPYRLEIEPSGEAPSNVTYLPEMFLEEMVSLPGGTFTMGSSRFEDSERPEHQVTISPFRILKREVTGRDWALVMGEPLPSNPDYPKDWVSWDDCQRFLDRLNQQVGDDVRVFRLPTEAEWEFAAAGDQDTPWFFGASAGQLDNFAWYADNSGRVSHPVMQKEANPYGLFDVYGNVAEWCQDVYRPYSSVEVTDPGQILEEGDFHVFRGGSRLNTARQCRTGFRGLASRKDTRRGLGFRIVADELPELESQLASQAPIAGLDRAIEELSDEFADTFRDDVRNNLGALYLIRGSRRYQSKEYELAIEDFQEAIQILPTKSSDALVSRCYLSWLFATCTDDEIRDGERSYQFAKRVNVLLYNTKSSWLSLTVLAAAHAELGEFDRAIARAQEAVSRAPEQFLSDCETRLSQLKQNQKLRTNELPLPVSVQADTSNQ
ncbi:Hypothetical protein PBC10988_23860 [Planctomycetales bacterium 10988]|nr:Hypothetical protein PBC10988_23860 [Planctomycetales bacterium 10988]